MIKGLCWFGNVLSKLTMEKQIAQTVRLHEKLLELVVVSGFWNSFNLLLVMDKFHCLNSSVYFKYFFFVDIRTYI